MKKQRCFSKQNYMRVRERNGATKSNVLASRSHVVNPKSDPDYSASIFILLNFIYPLKYLRVPPKVRVPKV
jgi:hypothetical protein